MKPHDGGGGGGGAGSELIRLAVTRSLRSPLALLPLLTIATVLTYLAAFFRHPPPWLEVAANAWPPPSWNATLLRLAAGEPAAALEGKAEVEETLIEPLAFGRAGRPRSPALWRKLWLVDAAAVRNERLLREARHALRDWLRNRRYDTGVMGELLGLIKGATTSEGRWRRYASCAVVGNSGILLLNDYGALIDSHEHVIRLNNARIVGYQRNVGSKTGMAFGNSNILHLCSRRAGCFCHPYGEHVPLVMYICQASHFLDYAICNISHKAPLLVTDARFDILCSRIVKYYSLKRFVEETGKDPQEWDKSHDSKMFHYSSGMQAVMLAAGICDNISIFGFGKSEKAKHHYHTNQKKELDLHDYEAQYMLYIDLIERPQVIPFLADSRYKVPPVVIFHRVFVCNVH